MRHVSSLRHLLLLVNLACFIGATCSAVPPEATVQVLPSPFRVPHLISAQFNDFQNYNGVRYVHGGTDLGVPGGTEIFAPVAGIIRVSHYSIKSQAEPPQFQYFRAPLASATSSPEQNAHLYVEVSITDREQRSWYFRHVIADSIPAAFRMLGTATVEVKEGDYIGRVVSWTASVTPEQRRYDHVHLELVDSQGVFLNPNVYLPRPPDTTAPVIQKFWMLPNQSEQPFPAPQNVYAVAGEVDFVLDTYDRCDGASYRHVPYEISWGIYSSTGSLSQPVVPMHVVYRFDRIPQNEDRTRYADIFFQPRIREGTTEITSEGNNVARRFLVNLTNGTVFTSFSPELSFDTRTLPDGKYELRIQVKDLNRNTTERTQDFQIQNKPGKPAESTNRR